MNALLVQIVGVIVTALKSKTAQDEVLDFFEDPIARTETKIDDRALLPLINAYRTVASVPDNDPIPSGATYSGDYPDDPGDR